MTRITKFTDRGREIHGGYTDDHGLHHNLILSDQGVLGVLERQKNGEPIRWASINVTAGVLEAAAGWLRTNDARGGESS